MSFLNSFFYFPTLLAALERQQGKDVIKPPDYNTVLSQYTQNPLATSLSTTQPELVHAAAGGEQAGAVAAAPSTLPATQPAINYNLLNAGYTLLDKLNFAARTGRVNETDLGNMTTALNVMQNAQATPEQKNAALDLFKRYGMTDDDIYVLHKFNISNPNFNIAGFLGDKDPDAYFTKYLQGLESGQEQQIETPDETSPDLLGQIMESSKFVNSYYDKSIQQAQLQNQNWWDTMAREAESRALTASPYLTNRGLNQRTFAELGKQGATNMSNAITNIEGERAKALTQLPFTQMGTLEPIRQFEANLDLQQQNNAMNTSFNLTNLPWGSSQTWTTAMPGVNPLLAFGQGYNLGNTLFGGGVQPTAYMNPLTSSPKNIYNGTTIPYNWTMA